MALWKLVTQLNGIWKKRFQIWRSYGSLANQQAALCLLKGCCGFSFFSPLRKEATFDASWQQYSFFWVSSVCFSWAEASLLSRLLWDSLVLVLTCGSHLESKNPNLSCWCIFSEEPPHQCLQLPARCCLNALWFEGWETDCRCWDKRFCIKSTITT